MPLRQSLTGVHPTLQDAPKPIRFDVSPLPTAERFLAWRNRVGQVIDVVPSREQLENPFSAFFDRFVAGDFAFSDCYSDAVTLERTIARISQDHAHGIIFHIFLGGLASSVVSRSSRRRGAPTEVGVLAVDMDQPLHVSRLASHHITFVVPTALVTPIFDDPGILHARVLATHLPSTWLIIRRSLELVGAIRSLSTLDRKRNLQSLLFLILNAFGAEAGLSGSKNALLRVALFDKVRRYVRANLGDHALSPDAVIGALGLSRPTIYRLFQHEGGLGTFIQNERLRAAAAELVHLPGLPIKDVGYAFGFSSASVFTRAFRREFDITPQELRLVDGPAARFDRADWL